jgi:hypothetical protein
MSCLPVGSSLPHIRELVSAMLVLTACGGSTLSPSDGGPSSDVTLGDAGVPPGQLVQGEELTLFGVTDDGYAVYADDDAKTLSAVSLAGGIPQLISALTARYAVYVSGRVAVVFTAATPPDANDLPSYGCTLGTWSSSTGFHSLSSTTSPRVFAVSDDSSRIMYPDGLDGGPSADLRAANVDGTGTTLLMRLSTQGGTTSGAYPEAHGSYFVVGYTPATGPGDNLVSSFRTDTWSRADLLTSDGFWVDQGATKVLGSSDGGIQWAPIDGGTPLTIDPAGDIALFTPDGASVIYRAGCCGKNAFQIRRSPVAAPSPVTLVDAGAYDVAPGPISPDGNWVVFNRLDDPSTGVASWHVVSTSETQAGAPILLPVGTLTWGYSSPSFTNDSSHVIYYAGGGGPVESGKLQATSVLDGSTRTLAAASWVGALVLRPERLGYQALGPSRVVFTENAADRGALGWTADIDIADTATAAPAVTIASSANPSFFLSPSGDRLVYTTSARTGPLAGLYVAATP